MNLRVQKLARVAFLFIITASVDLFLYFLKKAKRILVFPGG